MWLTLLIWRHTLSAPEAECLCRTRLQLPTGVSGLTTPTLSPPSLHCLTSLPSFQHFLESSSKETICDEVLILVFASGESKPRYMGVSAWGRWRFQGVPCILFAVTTQFLSDSGVAWGTERPRGKAWVQALFGKCPRKRKCERGAGRKGREAEPVHNVSVSGLLWGSEGTVSGPPKGGMHLRITLRGKKQGTDLLSPFLGAFAL